MMKILIVDDDPRIRKLIASLVSDLAVEIFECSDGCGANASYAVLRPDLVLMDIALPGIDGIAATGLIRSSYPDAKIIIVTSHDGEAIREVARVAGACGFVPKENIASIRGLILSGQPPFGPESVSA